MAWTQEDRSRLEQEVAALTSQMVRRYYCDNDVDFLAAQMEDDILWLGTGEQEWAAGGDTVRGIFRQFAGQVPKCNVWDEEYTALQIAENAYLCSGRMWIETAPETGICLRVHQRITTAFRLVDGRLRCCHIHISNPYGEMADEDMGFPTRMAEESTRYLREQVELQKQQLANQTEQLRRMSYEDRLTGLYNQNRFNELRGQELLGRGGGIGVVCLDLNGLKDVNDRQGHTAGDAMLCGAAEQMRQIFPDQVYRTGGDEFVVVEDLREEAAFCHAVETLRQGMRQAGISCSVGVSWRMNPGNIGQQYDEADQRMYEEKRSYYSMQAHDRRTRRK